MNWWTIALPAAPGHRLSGSIHVDLFAAVSAAASLILLQKYHIPIHYMVPIGALAGMIWKMAVG